MLFCDCDCVTDVVPVSVRAQYHVHAFYILFALRAGGIPHYPGVDQNCFAFGSLNSECGVSQPGDLDAVQLHADLSPERELNILVIERGSFNAAGCVQA